MHQLLHSIPPSMSYANKSTAESCELLYKIFKGDTKLVRSLLEANYFSHTESHEWNILWSSSSCKAYLYEGLNEHQKINHFPQSYELTRKDKLAINVSKM
jgi:tubulin polyglutamylase TTLL5